MTHAGADPKPGRRRRFRFLAAGGRVARRRPVVVAGGLLARAGLIRAFSLWPDATAPVVGMSPRDGAAARWMPDGFPRGRGAARSSGPARGTRCARAGCSCARTARRLR